MTKDHPDFIACSFMENSIGLKRGLNMFLMSSSHWFLLWSVTFKCLSNIHNAYDIVILLQVKQPISGA